MSAESPSPPIIIIGAPRSGTNMIRDVLARLPGCGTWPCDEINYIWRRGNARFPSDELPPQYATRAVQRFIRNEFEKLRRGKSCKTIVEKTCANSLRVGFVDRVFPDARYLFIVRNGTDAVASAIKRWSAPLDLSYILKKARYVPLPDVPFYASDYLANRIHRLFSADRRLASWGPKLNDLTDLLRSKTLEEVCAIQWRRCVDAAKSDLAKLEPDRIVRIRYEEFVKNPNEELARICSAFGFEADYSSRQSAVLGVTDKYIGKACGELSPDALERVQAHLGPGGQPYLREE